MKPDLFVYALRLVFGCLRLTPLSIRSRIGHHLGTLLSMIPTRDRRCAELQLNCFLGKNSSKYVSGVYQSLGTSLFEAADLTPILRNTQAFVTVDDGGLIDQLLASPTAVVALTAHTGNWELLAAYISRRGLPLSVVARDARSAALQSVLADIRSRYGVRTLWRSNRNGVREIVRELEQQRVIAALIDQDTTVGSATAPFFGTEVNVPSTLVSVAQKTGAILVSSFMFRVSELRYHLYVERFDTNQTVKEILAEYNRRLEHYIRIYPNQWVWFHKRWRTVAGGKRLSSTDYIRYLEGRILKNE